MKSNSFLRYWHTVRYLQARQICNQIRHRILPRRLLHSINAKPSLTNVGLLPWLKKPKTYFRNGCFRFLNRERDLGWPIDWNAVDLPELWQYHLHYFDYLRQSDIDYETGLALIRSWIQRNPPRKGFVGWEPYPLSLRLVNWLKFLNSVPEVPSDILQSLYLQAANLEIQVEYHILGNHLLSNGKALCWAGNFLDNERWLKIGKEIVLHEMAEQFYSDGGHFELSPMYHALALEDVLDLVNLHQCDEQFANKDDLNNLRKKAANSLAWLKGLVDDEGNLPLLNDSVYGVAPGYNELEAYAYQLEVTPCDKNIPVTYFGPWAGQNFSGYWVLRHGPFRLIFDTAPLGPDYLLGHAHCDMLAVQLDYAGKNILTDTGVFQYEDGEKRKYARSTAAHNTVMIDNLEQADLWKSFRVGRRGKPVRLVLGDHYLDCSHNGFSIWGKDVRHERTLFLLDNGFTISDELKGPSEHHYEAFYHFAPDVHIEKIDQGRYRINRSLLLELEGTESRLTTSEYYPEFGHIIIRPCLILSGSFFQQTRFRTQFSSHP